MIDNLVTEIEKQFNASDKTNIVVCGPTCSGKSKLAMSLAKKISGEIVGCDSVQLYKGFDVGSAKPSKKDQLEVKHHLFDRVDADQSWDASIYLEEANHCLGDIKSRGKKPILVGGTGLYLRAFLRIQWHDLPHDTTVRQKYEIQDTKGLREQLNQLDPLRSSQIQANDHLRLVRALELCELLARPVSEVYEQQKTDKNQYLERDSFIVKVSPKKSILDQRIEKRSSMMIEDGLIGEVEALLKSGVLSADKPMKSIGYKEVCDWLGSKKASSKEELIHSIVVATRQYAKRQLTWFAKVESHFTVPTAL